jgi:hypothetical protein
LDSNLGDHLCLKLNRRSYLALVEKESESGPVAITWGKELQADMGNMKGDMKRIME